MRFERTTFRLSRGTFHAIRAGDAAGRPLLFLHGFPDHPPPAEPFLGELADRGYRVTAPWMRGYAPSPTAGPFDLESLTEDVVELIDHCSAGEPVDLVGHDWGAAITYLACLTAPERVAGAVTLAVPHPITFLRQLRTPAQLRRSWYMAAFQLPGVGRIAAARDLALIDLLWRRWSPGLSLDPKRRAELHSCLARSLPAPIRYYRAALRPASVRRTLKRLASPVPTPLLQLHGADDGCVLPPTADDRARFAAPHALEVLPDVGHFLHLETPSEVARRVDAWLSARAAG